MTVAIVAACATVLTAYTAPAALSQAPSLSLNQNPLRTGSVVLRWPAAPSGPATVAVYSLLGTPVASATLEPDPGRWTWDGTTGAGAVTNGAYLIVVVRGDGQRMRRRLIVQR